MANLAGIIRKAAVAILGFAFLTCLAQAQVSVTTYHYDNARTGQNTQETILTPANVNSSQFGKLFSVNVDGLLYAQPLYLSNVQIGGGTHNVLYVATEHDSVYAIDADSGAIYWQVSLIPAGGSTLNSSSDVGCGGIVPEVGITSTPVIDTGSGTIYVLALSKVNNTQVQYLHALDVVTHAEKFGGPTLIQATVPGTATGGTTVSFDAVRQLQRPGLLLENGHVIIGWGSYCDHTPYHGWVMSYSANNIANQEAVFNSTPNGVQAGIWASGGGLSSDASGNIYFGTGNGTFDAKDYGDSIVKLGPPNAGSFPVVDFFTPFNQSSLDSADLDLGSSDVLLLPTLPSGKQLFTQMGKEGRMYLIDTANLGKYCNGCGSDTNILQEVPGASVGIRSTPAYWNGFVYWGSARDGVPDNLKAFSFNANNSGLLSTTPTSETSKQFAFSAPSPSVSSNGTSNGIVWALDNSSFTSSCCQVLYAYDATNLGNMLYNSSQAANSRDVPGGAVKFTTPVIANGKVYVGGNKVVSAYGLISTTPRAASPAFSPAPGSYANPVTVTLSDTTAGAVIHCTTDGSAPTANSPICTTLSISTTTTLSAIATATGFNPSPVATGTYIVGSGSGGSINYGSGFTAAGLTMNGSAKLNGNRLRLTDTGMNQAGSAFATAAINVQSFTTDFSFQLTSPNADGFTFTIQGNAPKALGSPGGNLAYGGIGKSVAVKFDLYNGGGEGPNSTGLYTNGAVPTIPAMTLGGGVNLHSGDPFNVHLSYDGVTLRMTITDVNNSSLTFSTSWSVNIPNIVGGSTAFVGFTGATGGATAIQEILTWTYVSGQTTTATPVFSPAPGTYSSAQNVTLADTTPGATIYYTTDGSTPTTSSTVYSGPVAISATTTINAIAAASGFTNSAVASGTYVINSTKVAATPMFNPSPGTFANAVTVTLSDTTAGAVIHCTTDGSMPTPSSPVCSSVNITTTATLSAIATAAGFNPSAVISGTYTITSGGGSINYGSGFTASGLTFNGFAKLNGTRLRLTDGKANEAASAFATAAINVQTFTTDFSFQLTNPNADGFTFTIQGNKPTAIGSPGGNLGYAGIGKSVAVKLDLYNGAGEGPNSTGLYTNGAVPTIPAIALGGGVNLHSGDPFKVHLTYNGTTLTMTITDGNVPTQTFTTSWTVNIPAIVGGTTAFVGFTGATGGATAIQELINWTYTSGS